MIPCTTTTIGKPINYCGANAYDIPPVLHIGELVTSSPDALVVFENLATGRTSFHPNTATAPTADIELPAGLSPGQMYRVSVEVDGVEVLFTPYVDDATIGTVDVTAVHTNARKYIDDAGEVTGQQKQWLKV
jgi:hypothetical protein